MLTMNEICVSKEKSLSLEINQCGSAIDDSIANLSSQVNYLPRRERHLQLWSAVKYPEEEPKNSAS
jgi:hypothetical protein